MLNGSFPMENILLKLYAQQHAQKLKCCPWKLEYIGTNGTLNNVIASERSSCYTQIPIHLLFQ